MVALLLFWTFMLSRTRFGRHMYAVGGNAEAARRAGIDVDPDQVSAFMICFGWPRWNPRRVLQREGVGVLRWRQRLLYAVGAAVIGGTSLFGGGRRSMRWSVAGDATIANGLGLLNQADINFLVTGGVLLLAASVDAISRRRRSAAGVWRDALRGPLASGRTRRTSADTTWATAPAPAPRRSAVERRLTTLMGLNRSTIADLVGRTLGLAQQLAPAVRARAADGPRWASGSPSSPYVVAVDLGVDGVVARSVSAAGSRSAPRRRSPRPEACGRCSVAGLFRRWSGDADGTGTRRGRGPGMVDQGRNRPAGTQPRLARCPVREIVAARLPRRGESRQRCRQRRASEHLRGAAVGVDDLVYISGNVGVGAGVIGRGAAQGAGGYAGEVGHLNFDPDGALCHCGSRGCWETVVGAHAIAASISYPADDVVRLDQALDELSTAPRELRPVAGNIGRGIGAVVNAFNPSMVILGGYFRPLYRLLRSEVQAGLADRALAPALESVRLAMPGLGTDSVLLGAAEMALEPVFDDPVASLATAVTDAHARLAASRIVPPGRRRPLRGLARPLRVRPTRCRAAPAAGRRLLHGGCHRCGDHRSRRSEYDVGERPEVAAEDDHTGVEHTGQDGQAAAEMLADVGQRRTHARVVRRDVGDCSGRRLRRAELGQAHPREHRVQADRRLPAAEPAASAARPSLADREVADLAGEAPGAAHQAATLDQSGTDPDGAGEVEQVLGAAAGAMVELGERPAVGVIADPGPALPSEGVVDRGSE